MGNSKPWNRKEDETSKAYHAFQKYIQMPPDERSQQAVADSLGYKSVRSMEVWSSKYDWVERALAYDDHMASVQLVARETTLKEHQGQVVEQESHEVEMLSRVIAKAIRQADADSESGDIQTIDLTRLTSAVESLQKMRRRMVGMPTSYRSEEGEDLPDDEQVFIVSSND